MEGRLVSLLVTALCFGCASGLRGLSFGNTLLKDEVEDDPVSYEHVAVHGAVAIDANQQLSFVEKFSSGPAIAAVGSFVDGDVTVSNFGQLHITTFATFPDETQMRAAGFLEGWLTAERIYDHHVNLKSYFNITSHAVVKWLEAQDHWARMEVKRRSRKDPLWAVTGLVLMQLRGLLEGYNARVQAGGGIQSKHLSRADFLLLQATGDVFDLIPALDVEKRRAWHMMEPHVLQSSLYATSKCSALVRVTDDFSDLLLSHSSWFTYSAMVRIYKHWSFALNNRHHRVHRASFSSYPGELASDDDFYMLDTGLVVLQTTNDIFNMTLYKHLSTHSLLNWQRVRVASAMAETGKQWAEILGTHNSGTYNNQYMIIDLKRFHPRQALQPGLLWVVEQIPGLVVSADKTETLEWGYWPSYNVPFFQEIYEKSGYSEFIEMQKKRGPEYADAVAGLSHQLAPRAKIFRRDVSAVKDLHSLKNFMRSNNYPHDPLDGGSSFGAICGRGDLNHKHPMAYGCYDTKVTSYKMAKELRAAAVNGPTTEGHPPFQWSTSGNLSKISHMGEVDKFDFKFEFMHPLRFLSDA